MSAVTTASTSSQIRQENLRQLLRQRRITDQIGRILLVVLLIIAAVVYLIVPFLGVSWLRAPFLGTLLEYPMNVNDVRLQMSGEAQDEPARGLVLRDTITAIDGQPIHNAHDMSQVLRQYVPGQTVALDVMSNTGAARQVSIKLTRMPLSDVLTLFFVPYLTGLLYLVVGLWVYRRRREQAVGRVFVMLCTAMALVLGTTFDLWSTHIFARLWTAAFPLTSGALVSFALLFPNEASFVARRPWQRWLPLVPSAVLLIWAQWRLGVSHPAVINAWLVQYYYAAVCIFIFLGALIYRAFVTPSPTVREQSRVVLGGAALSFLPFVLWAVNHDAIRVDWVILALLFFPLAIAYSIVQYRVLDTGRLLSRGLVYTTMAIIVTVGYGLLISGLNLVLGGALQINSPIFIAALTFVLVLVFQPVRTWLQQTIDSLFFRSREAFEEYITAFRHDLTMASGLSYVVRALKQQIREALIPTHIYVFLRDSHTGDFIAAGEGRRPDTDIRFESQSGLVHFLSTTRDILYLDPEGVLPPELIEDQARLAVLRTPAFAPLRGQDRLSGWVSVGHKRSGESFSIQDLRFVQTLAEQAALAIERAQVFGDLERRVRELDVLSRVAQAVNFTTDPDVLMELIYAQASKLIDTTNFYIVMHSPQARLLGYAFFLEGDERLEERERESWSDDEGLVAEVVRTGLPIRTDDYQAECTLRGVRPRETGHQAWMGVPLNAGASTLGALVVASYTPGVVFTDDQLKIFWAIADQAATALDKARLFRETETRVRQLAILNDISKELASTLELENLLGRIMRSAVEIISTEAGTLFLVDGETGDLVFRVVEGGAQELVGTRIPWGTGVVGESAETGQPVIVNDVSHHQQWFGAIDEETEFRTQSLLAIPLRIKDRSIGVLEVLNKRDRSPFDEDDVSLLATFAAQAAIAIENARLYQATDDALAARVDELQNLQRIDRELNRAFDLDRVIQITLDWALRVTGASAGAIAMLDTEGEGLTLLSTAGYDPEFVERYKEKPFPATEGIVGRVLASGKPELVTDVRQDPDHMQVAASDAVAQITVPLLRANKPIGVLVLESSIEGLFTTQDLEFISRLTEHAAIAIENARLFQEVRDANRSKTEFISFVAHELKNPMTSIRGYTDLLRGGQVGPVSDMQVQFLGTIRSNVDRMTRLVSDLADVARIEAGRLRLDMSPIAVKDVIDETLRGLQGQVEEKQQALTVEMPDDLPLILADHTRMVQVLTNLVSNAHKYTPDGGDIWVGAEVMTDTDEENSQTQQVIHHWVRDTGIGMSEEELEQLFTKFFRTERGKDMAQGTGLGLNITKNLVERHEGRVWVESEVGVGTTFHYTIPIAKEEESEIKQAAD